MFCYSPFLLGGWVGGLGPDLQCLDRFGAAGYISETVQDTDIVTMER